ncbi:hypothetical protein BDA96_04G018400 [Sorghum bicolor]|uniref:Uncharacterized protein n=1 Tax=Sorghum bicolor TaxID=4558 RepID=A0A921R150_SORBI|nr:hypothetical protein BDA96_04G018400 [Sorghum bicolor]
MGWGAMVLGFSCAHSRRRCEHEGTTQQHLHILSEICSPKLCFLFSLSDLTMNYSKVQACVQMRLLDGLMTPWRWQTVATRKAIILHLQLKARMPKQLQELAGS